MFKNNVYTFRNFPVEERQRKWTDCFCTILAAIFALTLFVLSFFIFTKENFYAVNYPVDDTEQSCFYQQADAPYIFFSNLRDISSGKYCLQECPSAGNPLKCSAQHPCPGVVAGYSSKAVINILAGFCEPIDENANSELWENKILVDKISLIGGYDAILYALPIGIFVGLTYLIVFVLLPRIMTYSAFFLAFLALLAGAIILIVQPISLLSQYNNTWNIIIGVVFIAVAVFMLIFFFCYKQEIQVGSIFMYYSNVFLKENPLLFLYILLFIFLNGFLAVLCIWQFIAFGSYHKPQYFKGDLYYLSGQSTVLQVLNAIEFIWGIQFLRDSFNYIVSGNAVEWYFNFREKRASECCRPFTRLLCKNFGSVVGGSFLNGFFSIFGLVYDLFRCNPRGGCGRASKCWKDVCCCCNFIFELVRPDAYAYIHLSGIPYCNAARQCQALCERSHLFSSDHSCIKLYRMAAQIFLVSLTAVMSFILLSHKAQSANFYILGLIIFVSYLAVTYFADIHSNGAEGIQTCYLAETNCEGSMNIDVCPDTLRYELLNFEAKYQLTPVN